VSSDWIQLDKNLPEKPETLQLIEASGDTVEVVCFRLFRFWAWVDEHVTATGRLGFSSIAILQQKFGGDEKFWETMKVVGWLGSDDDGLFIPGYKKRFSNSAKTRTINARRQARYRARKEPNETATSNVTHSNAQRDNGVTTSSPRRDETRRDETKGDENLRASDVGVGAAAVALEINWGKARHDAARIVEKLGLGRLDKNDRSLILKAAALEQSMGENFIWDSVEAVRLAYQRDKKPGKPRCAYFHGVLKSKCSEIGKDFNAILSRLEPPP
jgi:hypothetical protein